LSSNAVPPSVTPPSPFEWPQDLVKPISAITKDSRAKVTVTAHGFDATSNNTTFVSFKQVFGMIQMNGQQAIILEVIDSDNFTVNINSTNFYTYISGGVCIVDSGLPPVQHRGSQFFNRPYKNVAQELY